jgi:hypothetical protein
MKQFQLKKAAQKKALATQNKIFRRNHQNKEFRNFKSP